MGSAPQETRWVGHHIARQDRWDTIWFQGTVGCVNGCPHGKAVCGSIATVTAHRHSRFRIYAWGQAHFSWGLLMPFRTNCLRNKADEYRALAAPMTDGAIRLQLLNMAERYDQEAEQNERQYQLRADKATASR